MNFGAQKRKRTEGKNGAAALGSTGVVEYWSNSSVFHCSSIPFFPLLHHSTTLSLHSILYYNFRQNREMIRRKRSVECVR
jgi:hypothetical protein